MLFIVKNKGGESAGCVRMLMFQMQAEKLRPLVFRSLDSPAELVRFYSKQCYCTYC